MPEVDGSASPGSFHVEGEFHAPHGSSGPPMSLHGASLMDLLQHHEHRSEERYHHLKKCIEECCEDVEKGMKEHHSEQGGHMGRAEEIHVHNVGAHDGGMGGGGLGLAALAAMSNKGVGNDMAPLALASLMHRSGNDGRGYDGYGHGAGWAGAGGLAGAALGFVAGALVNGRRGGGLFGGDGDGNGGAETRIEDQIANTAILDKLGTLQGSVPLATAQLENVLLEQTIAVNNQFQTLGLGLCQSFANVNQNIAAVNQNVSEQGCQTRAAVAASTTLILDKINANTIAQLQAELAEARHSHRQSEGTITLTNTVTQVQAQAQQQQQQQQILSVLNGFAFRLNSIEQVAHATNQNIIAGNTGAVTTAAQTASPTNVNT
jgi:hypothetical protein